MNPAKGKIVELKKRYSQHHSRDNTQSAYLNKRLFDTYNKITKRLTGTELSGINIDLGSGDKGFSNHCASLGIVSHSIDFPETNLETDALEVDNDTVNFVTLNAVIEHIKDPSHILTEIKRVLLPGGLIFIRTPNWRMDYKNFFNDPTHIKPYSPDTIKNTLKLFQFQCLFIEPGLIEKSWKWWQLPDPIKWKIASIIPGGTKSIIAVGQRYTNEK